jgi:hypothetical protein
MSAFLGAMIDYFGNLSLEVTTRANAARKKIDAGTYGPTEISSDALGLWIATVEGWWDAALRPAASAAPLAFLKLRVGDAAAGPITIPVKSATGTTAPAGTNLTSADGNTTLSAANHLVLRFEQVGGADDRTQLQVGLRNLGAANPPAGVYEGFAYVDQTALAHIVAVIT